MKATELAQIISTLDMWGMNDNYYVHNVFFNTNAQEEFSDIFDKTFVREGYYLWVWIERDDIQGRNYFEKLLHRFFGVDYKPFLYRETELSFHFIIRIDDEN